MCDQHFKEKKKQESENCDATAPVKDIRSTIQQLEKQLKIHFVSSVCMQFRWLPLILINATSLVYVVLHKCNLQPPPSTACFLHNVLQNIVGSLLKSKYAQKHVLQFYLCLY